MGGNQPFLPGMSDVAPALTGMERAARVMLGRLDAQNLLDDGHALTVQLILDLSAVIGRAALKGQAAGMALASRELREAIALLPTAGNDAWEQMMRDMRGEPTPAA